MGRAIRYTPEILGEAVAASNSIAGVLRQLHVPWSGGMHAHISRRIKHFGLDTSHFTGQGHRFGQTSPHRRTFEEVLVVRPDGAGRAKPYMLRRALIESGTPYTCNTCGSQGTWLGQPLVLHVDHIDGNYLDCRSQNLRFLCPNCHSQTPSWAGKNKKVRTYQPVHPRDICPP